MALIYRPNKKNYLSERYLKLGIDVEINLEQLMVVECTGLDYPFVNALRKSLCLRGTGDCN